MVKISSTPPRNERNSRSTMLPPTKRAKRPTIKLSRKHAKPLTIKLAPAPITESSALLEATAPFFNLHELPAELCDEVFRAMVPDLQLSLRLHRSPPIGLMDWHFEIQNGSEWEGLLHNMGVASKQSYKDVQHAMEHCKEKSRAKLMVEVKDDIELYHKRELEEEFGRTLPESQWPHIELLTTFRTMEIRMPFTLGIFEYDPVPAGQDQSDGTFRLFDFWVRVKTEIDSDFSCSAPASDAPDLKAGGMEASPMSIVSKAYSEDEMPARDLTRFETVLNEMRSKDWWLDSDECYKGLCRSLSIFLEGKASPNKLGCFRINVEYVLKKIQLPTGMELFMSHVD